MMDATAFGDNFIWGTATSAYQIEGAYLDDGKGLSIWDVFTTQPGKVACNQNGNIACDFYNHYIQDIILMYFLNCRNFRFSLSWSRLFPNGIGVKNNKGIDFYDRVIDFCLEMGIEPWVTLYHWDLPQALELKGGWTNREIVNWFADYAETCALHFSDRVQNWLVLNEPMVFTGAGYFLGIHAPGKKGLNNFLAAAHHAVLCQAIGGAVLKSVKSGLNVGTTFSCSPIEPLDATNANMEAAIRVDAITNRMFMEPLLGLGYPVKDLKVLNQIESYIHSGDEKLMQFNMDFIGVQNYTREVVKYTPFIPYLNAKVIKASQRGVPTTTMNWEVCPESIYQVLKKFAAYPGIKNIIISENGAAFPDLLQNGEVHDEQRIHYFNNYLLQVLKAKNEGVPVSGYFAWSFLDNFEWAEGYRQRFGLVYVDYPTQKRIIKSSGHWFRNFLAGVGAGNRQKIAAAKC